VTASTEGVGGAAGEILAWDSAFWGFRVGRALGERLTPEGAARLRAWCHQEAVRCVYFLADPDHWDTVLAAESIGLSPVDVRVTFDRKLEGIAFAPPVPLAHSAQPDVTLRPHEPSDISLLEEIAAVSYTDSRFFFDRRFPRDRCGQLYRTWIRRSCEGWADSVLVAARGAEPVGFISCHLDDGGRAGRVGLVGVSERARGEGVGRLLIDGALDWFTRNSAQTASVVTQGRNTAAQRLYQRSGFLTRETRLWYHGWYPEEPDR